MARNFRLKDLEEFVTGIYLVFLFVGFGVLNISMNGVAFDLGGQITQIPNLTIATAGAFALHPVAAALRRTRKRMDALDKVGIGAALGLPFLATFITPLNTFVMGNVAVGVLFAVATGIGYILYYER